MQSHYNLLRELVMHYLLVYLLENKDIQLLSSEHDAIAKRILKEQKTTVFIFTYAQKMEYLEKLRALNLTLDELIDFNEEFSGDTDPALAQAGLGGVKVLVENLIKLSDKSKVLLLTIN